MNKLAYFLLIVTLVTVGACKDNEPPRAANIVKVLESGEGINEEVDQTAPETCYGEPTDELPEFDATVEATQQGERINLHVMVAEAKGLEVCRINLIVYHRILNESTGEWELHENNESLMMFSKIKPGEVVEKDTPVLPAEFPDVTEAGPPGAWSVEVQDYHEVRKPSGWQPPQVQADS